MFARHFRQPTPPQPTPHSTPLSPLTFDIIYITSKEQEHKICAGQKEPNTNTKYKIQNKNESMKRHNAGKKKKVKGESRGVPYLMATKNSLTSASCLPPNPTRTARPSTRRLATINNDKDVCVNCYFFLFLVSCFLFLLRFLFFSIIFIETA